MPSPGCICAQVTVRKIWRPENDGKTSRGGHQGAQSPSQTFSHGRSVLSRIDASAWGSLNEKHRTTARSGNVGADSVVQMLANLFHVSRVQHVPFRGGFCDRFVSLLVSAHRVHERRPKLGGDLSNTSTRLMNDHRAFAFAAVVQHVNSTSFITRNSSKVERDVGQFRQIRADFSRRLHLKHVHAIGLVANIERSLLFRLFHRHDATDVVNESINQRHVLFVYADDRRVCQKRSNFQPTREISLLHVNFVQVGRDETARKSCRDSSLSFQAEIAFAIRFARGDDEATGHVHLDDLHRTVH